MMRFEFKSVLKEELGTLSDTREALRLRLALARAEARDEWNALAETWDRVETEVERVGIHAVESATDINQIVRETLANLTQSYERIRAQLHRNGRAATEAEAGNGTASAAMVAEGAPASPPPDAR